MKTLTVTTVNGQVELTFSEVAQKWDVFKGSDSAVKTLISMCEDMGWLWDRKQQNYFTNFVAENAENFVADQNNKTTEELWTPELTVTDKLATSAQVNNLQIAFETRMQETWTHPVEKYGYGCRNMDEVLTHIRYEQLFDSKPISFKIN